MRRAAVLLLVVAPGVAGAQGPTGAAAADEFRGMALRGREVWVSGRGGRWGLSTDGGRRWRFGSVRDADSLVFVDVEVVGRGSACVLAVRPDGGLARVYRADDFGLAWHRVFELRAPDATLQAMAYWDDRRGIAVGYRADGGLYLLRTDNGCRSWAEVAGASLPGAQPGEGRFAAGGTAITTVGQQYAWIGTGGGDVARVLRTIDGGRTWTAHGTPVTAGPGGGIVGVAFRDSLSGVAVSVTAGAPRLVVTSDGGTTWALGGALEALGVPSEVRYLLTERGPIYAAVGAEGFGYSVDNGANWVTADTTPAFTVGLAARTAWTAGSDGRITRFDPAPWVEAGSPPER